VTRERGGQPIYSAIAIETGLALRLVFHQPLRQTEGLLRSIADVLGVDIEYAISDEAAACIADALMELALTFEATHFAQIRRRYQSITPTRRAWP
jgi:hypothetical protein